jgi:CO/xanthine dehydrogenase FAD-binding subunit
MPVVSAGRDKGRSAPHGGRRVASVRRPPDEGHATVEIARPRTVDAATAALAADPGADLLAGGTDLMVRVNLDHHRPTAVVALRRVDELRELSDRWFGAGVTYERLERSPHLAMAQAARTVGSPQIRSVGTLGGNLGTASPAGDTLPVLAALDADVVLASARVTRRLRWDDYLLGPKRTARAPDELVLGVELPEEVPPRQAFAKVGVRQAMVIATVNCCAVRWEDGRVHLALGAVGPTVLRARRTEAMLAEVTDLSPAVLDEVQRSVADEVAPITDHRSTEAYRRHAAGILARRTLERCWWTSR